MIESLPLEIIQSISLHLSPTDYYQLLFVNRAFYHAFLSFLYHDVSIHCRYRFSRFLQVTHHYHYVHHLSIDHFLLLQDHLDFIQSTLSHLQSLHVSSVDCRSDPARIVSFYRSFQSLVSLSLHTPFTEDHLLTLLSCHPQLEHLSVSALDSITVDLLTSIHQRCPVLNELVLEGGDAHAPTVPPLSLVHPNLKTLKLHANRGLTQYAPWLVYISTAYPQLCSLVLKDNKKSDSEGQQETEGAVYSQLIEQCPQLVQIDLCGVVLDPLLLQLCEQHQRTLRDLALCRDCLGPDQQLLNSGYLSGIQRLSITLPTTKTTGRIVQALGKACPKLEQLRLHGFHFLTGHLDLHALLYQLPYLTSLCLNMIHVSLEHLHQVHRLNRLKLVGCFLPSDFFESLSGCRGLQYLTLNDVHCYHHVMETCPRITISLPHQTLVQFKIGSRIRIPKAPYGQVVQWLHTKYVDQENWYHLTSYRENPNKIPVYSRPFSKQTNKPTDLMQGYVSLECRSVKAIFINKKRLE